MLDGEPVTIVRPSQVWEVINLKTLNLRWLHSGARRSLECKRKLAPAGLWAGYASRRVHAGSPGKPAPRVLPIDCWTYYLPTG